MAALHISHLVGGPRQLSAMGCSHFIRRVPFVGYAKGMPSGEARREIGSRPRERFAPKAENRAATAGGMLLLSSIRGGETAASPRGFMVRIELKAALRSERFRTTMAKRAHLCRAVAETVCCVPCGNSGSGAEIFS